MLFCDVQTPCASSAQLSLPSQVALQGLQALIRPPGAQSSAANNQLASPTPPATPPTPPVRPPPPPPAVSAPPISPDLAPPLPTWPQTPTGKGNPTSPPPPPAGKGRLGKNVPPSPPSQEPTMTEEMALAMAIDASLRTASAGGFPLSPSANPSSSWDSGRLVMDRPMRGKEVGQSSTDGPMMLSSLAIVDGLLVQVQELDRRGSTIHLKLAPVHPTHPASSKQDNSRHSSSPNQSSSDLALHSPSAPPLVPSAPPLPRLEGPISYPSVDTLCQR
ncbi:hypothetical protein R1flu_020647 [Riccia fluitans]|uniref:Uncharacterized protein n=1 Tax=Riccia fluitans TaxID=41844 RepID=A0ABD1ZQU1_9MARC